MTKSEPTEHIKKIKYKSKDSNGYEILDVLATGNEYAIYEINHPDINHRLKVLIDGHTDDSEKLLADKFNLVKQKYIEAKGLLYRSSNFGMMKNRVAHALASCLSSDTIDGNEEFDKLIQDIKSESKATIINRVYYLLPCIMSTMILVAISFYNMNLRLIGSPYWQSIVVLLASSMGGSMSILVNAKRLHFEEYGTRWFYFMFGIERLFLSFVAGAIAFVLVKSEYMLPTVLNTSYWKIMPVLIAAAFSEGFVPTVLGKFDKKV